MKTLLHEFAPMVSQLSEMLGQMYSTIPQASALDLTRQVPTQLVHIDVVCSYIKKYLRVLPGKGVWELMSYPIITNEDSL